MNHDNYVIDGMISAKSIAARVEAMAQEISERFEDTEKLVVIGLLRGSFMFIADLVRELTLPVEVDFLETSSYGDSTHQVTKLLGARNPGRMLVCALLDKPSRREVDVAADLVGFEIPDEFVVGYGIDYAQRNRNLPYIGAVRFTDK